jgi:hypothetical protein
MFIIGEAIVQEDVVSVKFACDVSKCKGACCTLEGGSGAPLLDAEIEEIRRVLPATRRYLNTEHRQMLDKLGFYEGNPGHYSTLCINDKPCIFVYYEDDIARCSLERVYLEGHTDWVKPISCHLYPVRISQKSGILVRYDQIPECSPARQRGREENIALFEFLEVPLRRRFGAEWYEELLKAKSKDNA